jgi:hypothetical protein
VRASKYAVNVRLRSPHPISILVRQVRMAYPAGADNALRMTIRNGRNETGVKSESRNGSGVGGQTQQKDLTASTVMELLRNGMRIDLQSKMGDVPSVESKKVVKIGFISTMTTEQGTIEVSCAPSAITLLRDLSQLRAGKSKHMNILTAMKRNTGSL